MAKANEEIKCEVKEKYGVIGQKGKLSFELRSVSWNGAPAKYDLRSWQEKEGREIGYKGVTMTEDELKTLYKTIGEILEKTPAVKGARRSRKETK